MSERRGKYNAIKTEVDGRVFASRAEARRYSELSLLEKASEISELECQPIFNIVVNKVHICNYIADFIYYDDKNKCVVVEDVKGMKTPVYRLKKKLYNATHETQITEIT